MAESVAEFKIPEKLVARLIKEALPEHVQVSHDAKLAACRSASIFILQVSIAAAERAQEDQRSTLENQDIIKAVSELGLAEFAPQLVRFGAQRKRNARRKESTINKCKGNKKAPVVDDADRLFTPDVIDHDGNYFSSRGFGIDDSHQEADSEDHAFETNSDQRQYHDQDD